MKMKKSITFMALSATVALIFFGIAIAASKLPEGTLCDTSNWDTQRRYSDYRDHADFHGDGCNNTFDDYAHTWGKNYGWGRFQEVGVPYETYNQYDWICIDYDVISEGALSGACEICAGTHYPPDYEKCVAALAADITYYENVSGTIVYFGRTRIGSRNYGVGDVALPDVTYEGTFSTDGVTYETYNCTKSGPYSDSVRFFDTDSTSRHTFRAQMSDVYPQDIGGYPDLFKVVFGYTYASTSTKSEIKTYSVFIGDPDGDEDFCDCLEGQWDSQAETCRVQ